jgi:integrase/recombinase XerD
VGPLQTGTLKFDQLSRWLQREGLDACDLTGEQAARFAETRRAAGVVSWSSPRSGALPLEFLREMGTVPPPTRARPVGPLEDLLADYGEYLSIERGLCDHTVFDAYVPAARLFLSGTGDSAGLDLDRLTPADVSSFLARECPKRSVSGTRDLVCALRSLLRYLHLAGLIERYCQDLWIGVSRDLLITS